MPSTHNQYYPFYAGSEKAYKAKIMPLKTKIGLVYVIYENKVLADLTTILTSGCFRKNTVRMLRTILLQN